MTFASTVGLLLMGYEVTDDLGFKAKISGISEDNLRRLLNLPADDPLCYVYLIPPDSLAELATYAESTPTRDDLEYFVEAYDPNWGKHSGHVHASGV